MAISMENVVVDERGCRVITVDEETGLESSKVFCTVPVDVVAMEVDKERGRRYYVVELGGLLGGVQMRVPAEMGAVGIARAVVDAGAWVDYKPLVEYLDHLIARKWHELAANQWVVSDDDDTDPGAISVYQQFLTWVDANIGSFDSGVYGIIEEDEKSRRIKVLPYIFSAFLNQVGVRNRQERCSVLSYWKARGWLKTNGDNKFSVLVRVGPVVRRMYEVVEELKQAVPAAEYHFAELAREQCGVM
ncbi:hypothetical protein [Desulfofundulus sp.]|uniref:hypothetical protein n=1 Tax=Desulfofundulus sp. TaxID=2282750 RepID=UPI003C70A158